MKTIVLCATLALAAAARATAQHEHHTAPPPTPTPVTPTPPAHVHLASPEAPAAEDRNLFDSDMLRMTGMVPRDPSGDAPDPRWRLMFLAVGRLVYNDQGGFSGDQGFESSNWTMLHLGRSFGRGRLSLMLMNSLEPWTFEKRGSPHLFQTGESYAGRPLVDHQHPHDLFMNLSATWRAPLASESAWWLQFAPVGEPAIGPTAFMHRASSGENPSAPLGHHWQDSTHISFNVVTAGAGWRWLAVEGSAFHGAEPDEDRTDIEGGSIDSAAGRVRLSFPGGWSAQASYAYLHEPEALEEGSSHRTTASVHFGAEGDRPIAATLLWGANDEEHGRTESWLLEGAWQLTRRDHAYGRLEWSEKDRHLLQFKGADVHPAVELPDIAEITALTVGYFRDLFVRPDLRIGAGADVTAYRFPSALDRVYGDSPISWHAFLRVRLGRPHASHGGGAAHH